MRTATVSVAEGVTLSKEDLMTLPHTVRIEGPAMETMRAEMAAHLPATLKVNAVLVVGPPLPTHLLVRYWVQPVLVIGPQ